MTYPHNCVDSKVNNPLHRFFTKKELLQTYQVHSLRHHSRCCRPELGPMFISTQFQKNACMNPVESIAVQESGNNLLSCTSVLTSGCRTKLYYPLYSGWSFPSMPYFFLMPGEACSWALSRFKRDGLSNICVHGVYPEFIKFVGVLFTDNSSFQECTKNDLFSSNKETDFFQGCKFFHLLNMHNSSLSYERIHPTEFSVLADNLFHSRVDYQLSTNSIYRRGVTALSHPITTTYYEVNNQLRVMQDTSPDHIIRLEMMCRQMKDHTFDNVETICNFLSKYSALSRFNRIVVSVSAGVAETELHSEEMCICLDLDKRSFYSSHFALKYLLSKKCNNVIFHRHDMSVGLYTLLHLIWQNTELPLVILFQHPCPTKNLHKLSIASSDCFRALSETLVESVHYVYDVHSNPVKKCWDYDSLFCIITDQCLIPVLASIEFTPQKTISEMGDDQVQHPVCGLVPRVGWAAWKNGIEVSFSVFRKV